MASHFMASLVFKGLLNTSAKKDTIQGKQMQDIICGK